MLTAVTCAGAFAAFLSTSSGLLVSLAGTFSHDVWPRLRDSVPSGVAMRRMHFRVAAAGAMVIPALLALVAAAGRHLDPGRLGVRARGEFVLPDVPARDLVVAPHRPRRRRRDGPRHADRDLGDLRRPRARGADAGALALLQQPAIVSVPVAFLTMIVVSLRDPRRIPNVEAEMLALHAPEGLGLRLADEDVEGALA